MVLDYKTGRPEKGLSDKGLKDWISAQVKIYRPQLAAYVEMAAKVLNLTRQEIEWAILFTGLPQLIREKTKVRTVRIESMTNV